MLPAKKRVARVSAADVVSSAVKDEEPAALPLQSFAELEIRPELQQALEADLTAGETVLWRGRRSRNPDLYDQNPILLVVVAGVCFVIAVGVWLVWYSIPKGPGTLGQVAGVVVALVFSVVSASIGVLFLRGESELAGPARECYVLTNRRAILGSLGLFGRSTLRSFTPTQLLGLERQESLRVPGTGDLIFGYEISLIGQTVADSKGIGDNLAKEPYGFLAIDHLRAVEKLVRQTLLDELQHKLDS